MPEGLVNIFQVFYHKNQQAFLDPAFTPFNNSSDSDPRWREYGIFRRAYKDRLAGQTGITGFVSWKFGAKAKITGAEFLSLIHHNPGYDVYFINPFPREAALYWNMWTQGENPHPGLIGLTAEIFASVHRRTDLEEVAHSEAITCYCNFWAGTSEFWRRYLDFVEPIYSFIENLDPQSHLYQRLWADADTHSGRKGTGYVPYIVERLFTEFLLAHPDIKVCSYKYSDKALVNRYGYCADEIIRSFHKVKQVSPDDVNEGLRRLFEAQSASTRAIWLVEAQNIKLPKFLKKKIR